ncbi:MAG: hypothetical protein M1127_01685 [Patescibacteria group bacterium]|nr:hypothetical protein [Patescibacteria group bacterium]
MEKYFNEYKKRWEETGEKKEFHPPEFLTDWAYLFYRGLRDKISTSNEVIEAFHKNKTAKIGNIENGRLKLWERCKDLLRSLKVYPNDRIGGFYSPDSQELAGRFSKETISKILKTKDPEKLEHPSYRVNEVLNAGFNCSAFPEISRKAEVMVGGSEEFCQFFQNQLIIEEKPQTGQRGEENAAEKQSSASATETKPSTEKLPETLDEALEMMKNISEQVVAQIRNDIEKKKYAQAIRGFQMLFNESLGKDRGNANKDRVSSLISRPFFREFIEKSVKNEMDGGAYPPYYLYSFMEDLLKWKLIEGAMATMNVYLTREKAMRLMFAPDKNRRILPETPLPDVAKTLAVEFLTGEWTKILNPDYLSPFKNIYDKFKSSGLEPGQEKPPLLAETQTDQPPAPETPPTIDEVLGQVNNLLDKKEFDQAKELLEQNSETMLEQLKTLNRAGEHGKVRELAPQINKVIGAVREGLANQGKQDILLSPAERFVKLTQWVQTNLPEITEKYSYTDKKGEHLFDDAPPEVQLANKEYQGGVMFIGTNGYPQKLVIVRAGKMIGSSWFGGETSKDNNTNNRVLQTTKPAIVKEINDPYGSDEKFYEIVERGELKREK